MSTISSVPKQKRTGLPLLRTIHSTKDALLIELYRNNRFVEVAVVRDYVLTGLEQGTQWLDAGTADDSYTFRVPEQVIIETSVADADQSTTPVARPSRKGRRTDAGNPLSFRCLYCHAAPGNHCYRITGPYTVVPFHKHRRSAPKRYERLGHFIQQQSCRAGYDRKLPLPKDFQ